MIKILITEDDELTRMSLSRLLNTKGTLLEASTKKEALSLLLKKPEICFFDLDLENDLDGLTLIKEAKKNQSYVVILTGREDERVIEEAYSLGCDDYLVKPFKREELDLIFRKFNLYQNEELYRNLFASRYITQDDAFLKNLNVLNEALSSSRPITIRGETGTGKTLIAKLIHEISYEGNNDKFVHLNCSELPENLMESELFGYEKGAFSGAHKKTIGKLELADGGTLFLDEIATMSMSLQQKLLRVIEEKSFYPLGSDKKVKSNFRVVSATCEDLELLVTEKKFREDLYFRIDGFKLTLPPLRERKSDLPFLIKHFMRKTPRRVVFSEEVKEFLKNYTWPGNIRELEKTIEILKTKQHGIIKEEDLPLYMRINGQGKNGSMFLSNEALEFIKTNGFKVFLESIEEEALISFQNEYQGKVRQVLEILKISNSSYYRIMDRVKEKTNAK